MQEHTVGVFDVFDIKDFDRCGFSRNIRAVKIFQDIFDSDLRCISDRPYRIEPQSFADSGLHDIYGSSSRTRYQIDTSGIEFGNRQSEYAPVVTVHQTYAIRSD